MAKRHSLRERLRDVTEQRDRLLVMLVGMLLKRGEPIVLSRADLAQGDDYTLESLPSADQQTVRLRAIPIKGGTPQ